MDAEGFPVCLARYTVSCYRWFRIWISFPCRLNVAFPYIPFLLYGRILLCGSFQNFLCLQGGLGGCSYAGSPFCFFFNFTIIFCCSQRKNRWIRYFSRPCRSKQHDAHMTVECKHSTVMNWAGTAHFGAQQSRQSRLPGFVTLEAHENTWRGHQRTIT